MTTMNNEDPADQGALVARLLAASRDLSIAGEVRLLCGEAAAELDRGLARQPAPLAPPSLTFTLREATELLAFFGESQTDVTVLMMPAGAVRGEDGSIYNSPAGLWARGYAAGKRRSRIEIALIAVVSAAVYMWLRS